MDNSADIIQQQQRLIAHYRRRIEALEKRLAELQACTAHGLLQDVYRDEEQPLYVRLDAAKAALKFESETGRPGEGNVAQRLDAARARAGLGQQRSLPSPRAAGYGGSL